MQEQLLPQHLGTANIHAVTIGLHSGDFDPDIITRRIADRCSFAPTADIDVLSRQLYGSATITALWFQVAVDVRRGRPRTRDFTRLVQYFARWPTDQSLRVLPIITAEYEAAPNQRSWLPWPGAASPTRCGRAIKQAAAAANPRAVVLPELANVERPQVTEWANQPEVRRRLEPDSNRHDHHPVGLQRHAARASHTGRIDHRRDDRPGCCVLRRRAVRPAPRRRHRGHLRYRGGARERN